MLVGADDHASAVRRAVLAPAPAADCGWATWQGLTPALPDLAAGTAGRSFVGDAGFVGLMPAGGGLLQWWFDVPWCRSAPRPPSPVTWLRRRFAHYAAPVPDLLAAVSDADIALYPHVRHAVPTRWGTGPSTLVGDAAHAFPPTLAQGASQTLEDAWLLTRALRTAAHPVPALRRYERARSARVRPVSRLAATELTTGRRTHSPGCWPAACPPR
ncbi:FAD-dependent monooxygenase [Pseudonocardia nigra]|uniref:FAD-dependent monooxygenase n=1 Tax=Pseudonocardia nigra TaxID=1921578 RepID=UPI001C5E3CF1|nr:FAD-dependent monooxygenase [Pseudonocardia nigra]